jgi:predicted enzyme related to lactoylglutathione lyase
VSNGDRLGEAKVEVGVVVRDADAMAAFYGDVLGLEEVPGFDFTGGSMRRFAHGDAIVKLVSTAQAPELSNPPNGPAGNAAGVRYISIAVDDLDATLERCAAAGGAVPVPKMEFRAGVHIAMVEDPEGNWVELVQSTG